MKFFAFLLLLTFIGCASKSPVTQTDNYLAQGEFYLKESDFSRARFYYSVALEKGQGDKAKNLAKLGAVSILLNQYDEALNYLKLSNEAQKSDDVDYNLALCFVYLNQPAKAYEILRSLYEKNSDDYEVLKLIIMTKMQTKEFQESFDLFEKLPPKIRKESDLQPYYVYTLIMLDRIKEADFQMINVKNIDVAKKIMTILKPKLANK